VGVATALIGSGILGGGVAAASIVLLRPTGALDPPPVADRRADILRRSPFGSLPPARIEAAAGAMVPVTAAAGQVIIEQGAEADRFYLIEDGRFRVTQRQPDGRELDLGAMEAGDVFGEIGLLTSVPRTATVAAETDGRLYALDREAFLDLVSAGPGLSSRLLDLHRGSVGTVRP